jgi:pimeloyl-ACP methyl ester carboxylesterase
MLALAYAAAHPISIGPLILVGCGTFDVAARAKLQATIAERMNDDVRVQLKRAEQLGPNECMRARVAALQQVYGCDLLASPHEDDEVDGQAHQETWDDMLRLQAEGKYPAAFAAIKVPVLMIHGAYDPHPGRQTFETLRSFLPQLEYREFDRCGHYPWLERATADPFFSLLREWLPRNM